MEEILAWIVVVLFIVFGALPALLSGDEPVTYLQALKYSFSAVIACALFIASVCIVVWAFATVLR